MSEHRETTADGNLKPPADEVTRLETKARELQSALAESLIDYNLSNGKRARSEIIQLIDELRPGVESEARGVGFRAAPVARSSGPGGWMYQEYSAWLSEVIGFCLAGARRADNLVSAVRRLIHPDSLDRLLSGHENDAVLRAAVRLETTLRELTGLTGQGSSLAAKALGEGTDLSIAVTVDGMSDRSLREGVRQLLMGAFTAFRNPQAHSNAVNLSTADAVVQVVILSYLEDILTRGKIRPRQQ